MADTVQYIRELQIKCTLQSTENEAVEVTRTITMPNPDSEGDNFRRDLIDLKTALMTGGLSSVIQPANWRDDGVESIPYKTIDVEFADITTTKVFYDLPT